MKNMRFRCFGCKHLCYNNEKLRCGKNKNEENHKKYCDSYEKGKETQYDFYQLVYPIVRMILWNWGLNLIENNDETCTINVYDEEIFKNKLIQELLKKGF